MLERKIIVTLLVFILLPTFALGGFAYFNVFQNLRTEKMRTVGLIAKAKHDTLINKLISKQQRLQLFSDSLLFACEIDQTFNKQCLKSKTEQYFTIEQAIGIILFDANGDEIFKYGQSLIKKIEDFSNKKQLALMSKKGDFPTRLYALNAKTHKLTLFLTFQADNLNSIFTPPAELGQSGEVFLADGDGLFITPPRYHSQQGAKGSIMAKPMRDCLMGQSQQVIDLDYRNVDVIHGYQFIPEIGSGCIMAHIEQVEAFSPLQVIELKIALLGLIIMFLGIAISFTLTKKIVSPIIALTNVTRQIHAGDFIVLAQENSHDEIGELAASFNRLTKSLLENQAKLEVKVNERTEALTWSEYKLTTIINHVNDAIVSIDEKGIISTFNRSAEKLLGYNAIEVIGKNVSCLMPKLHSDKHDEYLSNYITTGIKHIIGTKRELQAQSKTGELIDISLSVSETFLAGRRMFVGSMHDIADQKKIEKQQKLFQAVFAFTKEAMCISNQDYQLLQVNKVFENTFNFTLNNDNSLKNSIFKQTITINHSQETLEEYLNSHLSWSGELNIVNRFGQPCTFWINISLIKMAGDTNCVISFSDISQKVKEQEKMRFLANHDPLTGLLNRPALFEQLEHCSSIALRNNLMIALLFIDLDSFKAVNDSFGHDVGDQLLVHIAKQLSNHSRQSDCVARIGGDEFVMAFVSIESQNQVGLLCEKLLSSINEKVTIKGIEIQPKVSIGIAMYPDDARTLPQLLKYADEAMYKVKNQGKNSFAFYK